MIYTATNELANKQDVEEDFAIQLSSLLSWEHLLSPAPLSIGLLGDLMIMSSEIKDFPIDGQLPQNGAIRYVKYPKSFRTTLVQISNEALRAFMKAHNNMDRIKIRMGRIPPYMKEATQILVSGNERYIVNYLPAPMNRIKEAANMSVALSKEVVLQFEHVMNLTMEVLEMCTSEKTVQEAKLETNFDRQSITNNSIPFYGQLIDQMNRSIAEDKKMMLRQEENMKKALDEMPSGWEMVGMNFVQNFGNALSSSLLAFGQAAAISNFGSPNTVLQVASVASKVLSGSANQEAQGES